ncbi:glucosaminidase domain-containing protein [Nitrospirillum sp. BR 11164]|uniref:glucosaminidase domain-containing protein n=1 Tax=Nitrospirillum sp. BR 11164 TaxID=3104324 RepID=UPI002B00260D|nr:glucosaminidase domain-containing protein [Nitrospirillum sp. BR 11164]MEA1651819.1 glucosaminidase domain-containing protein [Nitrospirillum sp. BR 11164]
MSLRTSADDVAFDRSPLAITWRDRRCRGIVRHPVLAPAGLILGAGTLLAKRADDAWASQALDFDADRLLALLTIAYDRPHTAEQARRILAKVRAAGRALAADEPLQAAIHLAHAGLGVLPDADTAARRLFLAETLLDQGMALETLRKVAGYGHDEVVLKHNQNHRPSGPGGGQFCSSSDTGGGTPPPAKTKAQGAARPVQDDNAQKKRRFVQRTIGVAREIAAKLNVPVENILGVSALESGWGGQNPDSRFAKEGNNYFGQHAHSKYENGTMLNKEGDIEMSTFASPEDSFRSFAESHGDLIRGVRDPEEFARKLQESHRFGIATDGSPMPTYIRDVAGTIRKLRPIIAEHGGE